MFRFFSMLLFIASLGACAGGPPVSQLTLAGFEIDTGRDLMTNAPTRPRLVLVIQNGPSSKRHIISSCEDPALGSALGGGGDILEVAGCDAEYHLITSNGLLSVSRIDGNTSTIVFSQNLPDGEDRAVRLQEE